MKWCQVIAVDKESLTINWGQQKPTLPGSRLICFVSVKFLANQTYFYEANGPKIMPSLP